jgi:UPF0716 family protein affecting phage T7 exclusion
VGVSTAASVSGIAVVLAALGAASLLVVLSASAVAGTVAYRKHRKAQQTLARETDQFSSHAQIEVRLSPHHPAHVFWVRKQ